MIYKRAQWSTEAFVELQIVEGKNVSVLRNLSESFGITGIDAFKSR